MTKRVLSMVLCIAMVLSMVPAQVFAVETAEDTAAQTIPETTAMETVATEPAETQAEESTLPPETETVPVTIPEETAAEVVTEAPLEETTAEESTIGGTCGTKVNWTFADGVLTISGTGTMGDYDYSPPWESERYDITKIVIEYGVTSISDLAFNYCTNVADVSIASSVASIGYSAFGSCEKLESIAIPDSVTQLGAYVFYNCGSLKDVILSKNLTVIPEYAFEYCSVLETITLPDGVTEIEAGAFLYSGLKEISLPDSLTTIGSSAFTNCESLETVVLPDSVTQLGSSAFSWCSALKNVTLSKNLTVLPDCAFQYCTALETITIPSGVTALGSMEEDENAISSSGVFQGCSSLTEVKLPDTLKTIGHTSFYECKKLKSIVIPGSVTQLGTYSFYCCRELKSVTLSKNLTKVPIGAFSGCWALEKITLPDGLEEIGESAFGTCTELPEINIPDTVTTIGGYAFSGCRSLAEVTLPSKLKTLGERAFYETALKSFHIPAGVTMTGNPIPYCSKLTKITVASGNTKYTVVDNVLFSKDKKTLIGYPGGIVDTSYSIPKGTETIGSYAFANNYKLKDVEFPSSLRIIEESAFWNCLGLKVIVIPEGVTEIHDWAFGACSGMEILVLPESLEVLKHNFDLDLTYLCYGGSEAQWQALGGDSALRYDNILYNFSGELPLIPDSGRHGSLKWDLAMDGTLTISGYNNMQTEQGSSGYPWSKYKEDVTRLVIDQGVYSITQYAFQDFKNLKTVSLPKTLYVIEADAFAGCDKLTSASYPGTRKEFYNAVYVMEGNEDLTDVLRFVENIDDLMNNKDISINGPGSAIAWYKTAPKTEICYSVNGVEHTTTTDKNGIFSVALGQFDQEGTTEISIQVTGLGGVKLDTPVILTARVTVTPFTLTQTWQASFDAKVGAKLTEGADINMGPVEAKATLASLGVSAGRGNSMRISREISGDKQSLEVVSDAKASVGAKFESGVSAEFLTADVDVVSAEVGVTGASTVTYGLKIDDFTGSLKQSAALGTFFLGEILTANPNMLFFRPFYQELAGTVYEKFGGVTISGSGAALSGSAEFGLGSFKINDQKLFSAASGEGKVTISAGKQKVGPETQKSTSYTVDANLSVLSLGAAKGLLSRDYLGKDISVTAKRGGKEKMIETTSLSAATSGMGSLIFGENYVADYNRYTFTGDALSFLLRNARNFDSYLNGSRIAVTVDDLNDMAQVISTSTAPIQYSTVTKDQMVTTIPLEFGASLGVGVSLQTELAYMSSTEYSTKTGYAMEDTIQSITQSGDVSDLVDENTLTLEEIINASRDSLIMSAKSFFGTVTGTIKEGVKNTWSKITGAAESVYDRTVSIVSAAADGIGDIFGVSYSVDVCRPAGDTAVLGSGIRRDNGNSTNYEFSKAATIGRVFYVSVTDNATGEAVMDFSDEPLEFTIRYAAEDLEAAGLSAQSAVVLDGEIAMYRYSDNGDYFEFVGGANDLTAMTVTAQITKPGQYVLAVDSCAPSISALDMSDFRETPTIKAVIDDLSGLDVSQFAFKLDGEKKVDGANIAEYFNSEAGIFTYAVKEALSEGRHTMSFTLADTTGNSETYEYSFFVDLTAPVVTDVIVDGYTNEGSCVEIRAQVSDENLTSVYALFSKKLPDGTWTDEVGAEMGDMGDGLWGLDYEGDGSSVKVRICATDVAENQTFSAVFEAKPYVEGVEVAQDYLALRVGQTMQLTAEVKPSELASSLTWKVEEGSESVISVDGNGNVTAKASGTGYVLATATDGEKEITARCRIDVAESLKLDGVKLSTNQITTELYSTDYAKLDILLLLPQNYATASADNSGVEKLSAAISDAYFTDETLKNLFALNILDDRTVEIVPTDAAINGENIAKSYVGTITVNVEGTDYITENLTLTVKKTLPKLKVKIDNFNAFYSGQSQGIQVTGATATNIEAENLPEWLSLSDNQLYLTADAPQKNASAKVNLEIWTEEWAIPVKATVSVKNTYKAPGLKLSATSVQLSDQTGSSNGVELKLMPKNKKETLDDLKVRGVSAPEGYSIVNYADGSFTLKAEPGFKPGKINLEVSFTNTDETVKLPITVKTAQVKLKLAKSSVSLNAETGDSALVGITATPNDYILSAPSFRLVDSANSDKLASGELEVRYEDGAVRINTTDKTTVGANYTLYVKAGGSREVALKIKTVGGVTSVTLKQSGNLDLSFPEQAAAITANFKNYAGGKIAKFAYTVTETKTGENATELFAVEEKGGVFYLTCTDPAAVSEKGAYMLNLTLTLADGNEYDASLKLKISRTAIKLKLAPAKLTLNKAVNDTASISITCTTKGYDFVKPSWQLMDKSGKGSADGKLDIQWVGGKLQISTNAASEYGATYKLMIAAEAGAASTALNIAILAENKSNVASTLKVKGNLDVIRDSSVIVTPSYKNCSAETAKTEELIIVNSANEDVTKLFNITKNGDGSYKVSIAKNAEIDLTKKYQVKLVSTFGDIEVTSKAASLSIKMGPAKLAAEVNGTLFTKDKNSRVDLAFTSADRTLNEVARVEIKDAKYADIFEIHEYGNGEFGIGFKDGKPIQSAKPITLTLNVYLDGNTSAKPNATVKLKLSITP